MPVEIEFTRTFLRSAKTLNKKYASFPKDLANLIKKLKEGEEIGQPLGNKAYKSRLQIRSKNKGKSGGARVITFREIEIVVSEKQEKEGKIVLLHVYDKSETESLPISFINALIDEYLK